MGNRFFAAIGRLAVRLRWLILVAWLVAVPLMVWKLPTLSSVTKEDNSAFLPAKSASMQAADLIAPFQAKDTVATSVVVVSRDSGPLTAGDMAAVTRLVQKVGRLEHVNMAQDRGLSTDGRARQILVGVSGGRLARTSRRWLIGCEGVSPRSGRRRGCRCI